MTESGRSCPFPVRDAEEGEPLRPGIVLLAPRDDDTTIYDFHGTTLVRCPKCRGRAFSYGTAHDPSGRFICEACGLASAGRSEYAAVS
jgi:hypothetical protein